MGLLDFFKGKAELPLADDSLTTPGQIYQNLLTAKNQRLPVTLSLTEHTVGFQTIIVEVNQPGEEKEGSVFIDVLLPNNGNDIIRKKGARFKLFYRFRNTNAYEFESGVIQETEVNALPSFEIRYPKIIRIFQRRENFRVSPTKGNPVIVEFPNGRMEALDISVGGVSFHYFFQIDKGTDRTVLLRLPTQKSPLKVKMKIIESRRIQEMPETPFFNRAKFLGLTLGQQQEIAHYINTREREISKQT